MSQHQSATIEDYKKYVKELKTRIKQLTEKSKNATDELRRNENQSSQKQKQGAVNLAIKLTKKAVIIQKFARRFLVRKKLGKRLEGKQSAASRLARPKEASDNEALLLEMFKRCERMGLNLEMLFRAADAANSGEVSAEAFKTFLPKLKINLSRQDIAKFLYLVDEDGTGTITREEFCSTLCAFGISSEPQTSEISKRFLHQTLTEFHEMLSRANVSVEAHFGNPQIKYSEFLDFISNHLETNQEILKEKQKHMLINHFDRQKRGFLDKRFLLNEISKIPYLQDPKSCFQEEAIERTEAMSIGKGSVKSSRQAQMMRSPLVAKPAPQGEINEGKSFKAFVQGFERNKQSLQLFFDVFVNHFSGNRSQINANLITFGNFQYFLMKNFSSVFNEEFIESFCSMLQQNSDLKRAPFKLKPSGLNRPSSTHKHQGSIHQREQELLQQNFVAPNEEKSRGSTLDDSSQSAQINIIEFKNKLFTFCNNKPDTSKFLKLILALKIDQQGISTSDYFKNAGINPRQKVDFSQFFILGQKILEANFQEVSAIFETLQPSKEGLASLATFISEVEALRTSSEFPLEQTRAKPAPRDAEVELQNIKKKLAIDSLNTIEALLLKMKNGCLDTINASAQNSNSDNKNPLSKALTNDELKKLMELVDTGSSGQGIELHELLDFVLCQFSAKEEVFEIYLRVVAGYLDKNEPKNSTEDFFKRFKLHPNGFYDKLIFVKKIRQIFGFSLEHSQLFVNAFADEDTESVSVQHFIQAINKFRRTSVPKEITNNLSSIQNEQTLPNPDLKKEFNNKGNNELNNNQNNCQTLKPQILNKGNEQKNALNTPLSSENPNQPRQVSLAGQIEENLPQKQNNSNLSARNKPNIQEKVPSRNELKERAIIAPVQDLNELVATRNDQNGVEHLTHNQIVSRLKQIFQSKSHECQNIDQFIQSTNQEDLNIIYLRHFLKSIFEENELKIFLKFFRHCDVQKNGLILKSEWELFAKETGLRMQKSEQPPKSADWSIQNERDFCAKALIELNDDQRVSLDLINEFLSFKDRPVSILYIKRTAQLFCENETAKVQAFMKLLRFLDGDNNSSFSLQEIRFTVYLMNFSLLTTEAKSLDCYKLKNCGINETLVKIYSGVKNEETREINIFSFAKNAIGHFVCNQQIAELLNLLVNAYKNNKGFKMSYFDFLAYIGAEPAISQFTFLISKAENLMNFGKQLIELKKSLMAEGFRLNKPKVLNWNKVSSGIKRAINFDKLRKEDKENFEIFVAFAEVPLLASQKSIKNLRKSAQEISQENFEGMIQIVKKKIADAKLVCGQIENKIKEVSNGNDLNFVNFITLKKIFQELKICLPENILLDFFNHLEKEKSRKVCVANLIQYVNQVLKELEEHNKRRLSSSAIQNDSSASAKLNQSVTNAFGYLKNLELSSNAFYLNKKTITNDIVSALKVAVELSEKIVSNSTAGNKKERQAKFEDPEFGPSAEDPKGKLSIYFEEVVPGMVDPEEIIWLRPEEISLKSPPLFLDSGASCNDVIQGMIGDCWFISALSILATNDKHFFEEVPASDLKSKKLGNAEVRSLVSGVYPKIFHFLQKYGIYVMRFFKDYGWRYVIIDDRLPCFDGNPEAPDLIFARCDKRNEFWVPLIEKAYAKIHGTYQALISGQIDDGLVDMTGCVSDKLKLKAANGAFDAKTLTSPEALWSRLNEDLVNGSMMGCSIVGEGIEGKVRIDGEFIGLICGHAYSLLDLIDIGTHKLLRIRNPWGSAEPVEWNGAWSDNSRELIQNLNKINAEIKKRWKNEAETVEQESKDGCFLMEYNEFLSIWHNIAISKNFADQFSGIRFCAEWNESNSGGTPYTNKQELFVQYLKNPQFIMNIKGKKEVNIFISLGQEDGRTKSRGQEPFPFGSYIYPISMSVFSLKEGEAKLPVFDAGRMKNPPVIKNYRDIQLSLKLSPGKYAIIPSTKQTECFGKFFLNIYFDCPKTEITIEHSEKVFKGEMIKEEEETVEDFDPKLKELVQNILLSSQ